jgi:hypothetical protein
MPTPAALPALGPDDSVSLFDCLKQSLSQDSLVQKSAEAALEQYERRPNFCACLAVSCSSHPAEKVDFRPILDIGISIPGDIEKQASRP